jgi:hydrogenase maturation protease
MVHMSDVVQVAPILVFAVGNESRGDDALGPLLLRELQAWLTETGLADDFELLEEFQLQVEHAMDMKDRRLVLFIDAGLDTPAPYSFCRAQENKERVLYSHALSPEALLKVYVQLYQQEPPEVFVLCIAGESFELGQSISALAMTGQTLAFAFAKRLALEADALVWHRLMCECS